MPIYYRLPKQVRQTPREPGVVTYRTPTWTPPSGAACLELREPGVVTYIPVILPFPVQIGRLRSASEKYKPTRPQTVQDTSIPRTMLELPLDEIGTPRDIFPTFFPRMQSASDELVLAHLLSTISREGYRYVGLFATDPRDKLFLARKIREYCPDVGLFTVESDLLYTHPDYNQYLEGMIVASTYPLFNSNQLWSPSLQGKTVRRQFSRNAAQGAYNATLALLGRTALLDYGEPFKNTLLGVCRTFIRYVLSSRAEGATW